MPDKKQKQKNNNPGDFQLHAPSFFTSKLFVRLIHKKIKRERKKGISIMNEFKENKGAIILLYGTSTSGKTTICKELLKFINPLIIDSTDIAFKRLEEYTFDKIHNQWELAADYLMEMSPPLSGHIYFLVLRKKI